MILNCITYKVLELNQVQSTELSKYKDPRIRGANDVNPSLRTVEDQCIAQVDKKVKRGQIPPFSAFCCIYILKPGWRGRWEGGSGWGIHVYPRLIHANV